MAQAVIPNQLVDGHHMISAIGEVLEKEENEADNCALLDEIAKRVEAGGGWSKEERQECRSRAERTLPHRNHNHRNHDIACNHDYR